MEAKCENCKFWWCPERKENPEEDLGWCRRYPPTEHFQEGPPSETLPPLTSYDSWCGEFKAINSNSENDFLDMSVLDFLRYEAKISRWYAVFSFCHKKNIETMQQFIDFFSVGKILELHQIGPTSAKEIKIKINEFGFELKEY